LFDDKVITAIGEAHKGAAVGFGGRGTVEGPIDSNALTLFRKGK
jgi:hypothetical protein